MPSCDLILALDVPTREAAAPILRQVRGRVRWVKIGLQLFTAYGPNYVREVAGFGFEIFLDLKLHDIPNTVASAVASLSSLPVKMLTLHTAGGREMMAAALETQEKSAPGLTLLGVTVLTSMDDAGLREIGVEATGLAQVQRLAALARDVGLRGLVCSPLEVKPLRAALGPDVKLITPGVRPAGAELGDQKRVLTPADAAAAGSSFIVVGRPILQAPDPAAAAQAILDDLARAS